MTLSAIDMPPGEVHKMGLSMKLNYHYERFTARKRCEKFVSREIVNTNSVILKVPQIVIRSD